MWASSSTHAEWAMPGYVRIVALATPPVVALRRLPRKVERFAL
jgi:hypothetical protein